MTGMIRTPFTRFFAVLAVIGAVFFSAAPAAEALTSDTSIVGLVGRGAPTIVAVTTACYTGALLHAGLSALQNIINDQLGTEVATKDASVANVIKKVDCTKRIEKAAAQVLLK